jgi:uncharacterized protein YjbI with pentapeptide repeats
MLGFWGRAPEVPFPAQALQTEPQPHGSLGKRFKMNRIFVGFVAVTVLALCAVLVLATGTKAQDAGQIAAVKNGGNCPGCNLFQADLAYIDLPGIALNGARLRQADLSLVTMNDANFSKADLSSTNAFGGRFSGANFAQTDLTRANFTGAYLGFANFTGAKLAGMVLSGAELTGARGLTQSQLNLACGDGSTILPAGMSIPHC